MSNADLTRTTASTLAVVCIAAHGYEVEIDAARGGRIVSASFEGVDVLRRDVTSGASSALESACFPLVPYSNRIRRGQFVFEGETHQLAPNWDGDEHVIHGEGWQRAWDIVEQDTARAVLRLTGGKGWPWPYECLQEITVSKAGIGLSLTLRNTGQTPMPAGLGFPRSLFRRLARNGAHHAGRRRPRPHPQGNWRRDPLRRLHARERTLFLLRTRNALHRRLRGGRHARCGPQNPAARRNPPPRYNDRRPPPLARTLPFLCVIACQIIRTRSNYEK